MNIFAKTKNFYLSTNKLLFTVGISTAILALSTFWHPFVYLLLAFVAFNLVFLDFNEALCLNFYFLAFTGFLFTYVGVPLLTFIALIVKFCVHIKRKALKLHFLPLVVTVVICIVFCAIYYTPESNGKYPVQNKDYAILQGLLIVGVLFMLYLCFEYRHCIDGGRLFEYLIGGIAISAVLGIILNFVPIAKMYSFNDWKYGLWPVSDRCILPNGRFEFLCFHPNHLYPLAAIGIAYISCWALKKDKKSTRDIVVKCTEFAVLTVVGFLTMSKAFLLLFVLIVLFSAVMFVVTYKIKSLYFLLPLLAIAVVTIVVLRDKFVALLERFLGEDGKISLTSILTGRADIWKAFLDETFSTPWKAMFGLGLLTADIVDIGPHSLYISLLYRFGIVGILALGALVYCYIRANGKLGKLCWLNFVPLALFAITVVQEACLDERLFLFVASVALAFSQQKDCQTTTEKTEAISEDETAETQDAATEHADEMPPSPLRKKEGNGEKECEQQK